MRIEGNTKKYVWITAGVVLLGAVAISIRAIAKRRGNRTSSVKRKAKEGEKLIGKTVVFGPQGYVNIRSSARVDNENWSRLDFSDNLIGRVNQNPVGTILKRLKGEDGYYWYWVQLNRTVNGIGKGYVREDAVLVQY